MPIPRVRRFCRGRNLLPTIPQVAADHPNMPFGEFEDLRASVRTESDDHGTDPGEAQRLMTASRSRCLDRTGLRANHRQSRTLSLRQAGGELSGTGAIGRIQWKPATLGAYHQTSMMRFLLVEAAQVTVRSVPGWRSK